MGFSNENKKRSVWKNKKLVRKKRKRRNKKRILFNTLPNGNPSKYQPQPYNLNPIWTGSNRNRSYTKLPENQNFENFIESNLKFSNFWNDFYILLYKNLSICKFVKKNYRIDISRPKIRGPSDCISTIDLDLPSNSTNWCHMMFISGMISKWFFEGLFTHPCVGWIFWVNNFEIKNQTFWSLKNKPLSLKKSISQQVIFKNKTPGMKLNPNLTISLQKRKS